MVGKGKFLSLKIFQLINKEGMIMLEYHHFVNPSEFLELVKNHQQLLIPQKVKIVRQSVVFDGSTQLPIKHCLQK